MKNINYLITLLIFSTCQPTENRSNNSQQNESAFKQVKKAFAAYDNKPVFVDTYLYEKVSKNCLLLDVSIKETSVPVLLVDWNNNGSYLDYSADYIGIQKSTVNKDQQVILSLLEPFVGIEVNGDAFDLRFKQDKGTINTIATARKESGKTDLVYLDELPNLRVKTLDGQDVGLRSLLEHHQWVLLDFWATWCAPCITKLRELDAAESQFNQKVAIATLAYNCSGADEFLVKEGLSHWTHLKADSMVVRTFQITSVPRNFLFNSEGKLISANISTDKLVEIINGL
ncbi:hypothetical protein C900_05176 [Fulvivirga imtechensis AK7]|uniref:Thioredoxin domain-containing protein n=1 Tax=Fulvivirga imtechensis AK7 TaxID=1237149 RepID=L8JPK2_9BACT|nr:TlpA disulfide reductase family protein [Fulvivirga imtechensis]ELR69292.1 hypothetical protein C900_05176 [Fulvivirga imtechensis AK7]